MAIDNSTISHIQSEVASSNFTLETNAHVFKMLTTNVYNDVILAGIREISTNAIDGCKAGNLPIKFDVHVPTISNPTFSVRDYGVSISPDRMMSFYTTMGASDKRDSNSYNGQFGIGKLAPLAYATSFTVQSYYDGLLSEYLVSIDNGIPVIVKLLSNPTTEPNGLKVSYNVKPEDISKFRKKMEFLYKFFDVKPDLSEPLDIDIDPYVSISGTDWKIFTKDAKVGSYSSAYIVMANVPYEISTYSYDIPSNTVITVPTGSVSITPGRESLNYDTKTEATILQAITTMRSEVAQKALVDVATASTPFEQALVANSYLKNFNSIIKPNDITLPNYFTSSYTRFELANPTNQPFYLADFNGSSTKAFSSFYIRHDLIFVKQDVPSNFTYALKCLDKHLGDMIVIKPSTNSLKSIEAMVPAADTWLGNLGIPKSQIYSASDYMTETSTSVKSKTYKLASKEFQPTEISIYDTGIRKRKLSNIDLDTNTLDYLYFPMKGNDILTEDSLVIATALLSQVIGNLRCSLIGVPQKALKHVEADNHFEPAVDYFKRLVPNLPNYLIYSNAASDFLDIYYITSRLDSLPEDIQTAVNLAKKYTNTASTIYSTAAQRIKRYYDIHFQELKDTSTFETIKDKYPLLAKLQSTYPSSQRGSILTHYFKLEKFYADNSSD